MSVLVTGGVGFIGSHLVRELAGQGDDTVMVLDNLHRGLRIGLAEPERAGTATFIEGDIRDAGAVGRAMEGCEVFYHLAAQSNVLGAVTDLDYSFTTNDVGTYNVLAAARGGRAAGGVHLLAGGMRGGRTTPCGRRAPAQSQECLWGQQGGGRAIMQGAASYLLPGGERTPAG